VVYIYKQKTREAVKAHTLKKMLMDNTFAMHSPHGDYPFQKVDFHE
jgi:hypothetical protein